MSTDTRSPHVPPTFYTDPSNEHRVIREAAALFDRSSVDTLEMTGDDRARFLNGQVTCDVGSLSEGDSIYGFFTTAKGRIEADVTVLCLKDRLWLELPTGVGPSISERLRKYIIFDRVEVAELDAAPLSLVGPHSADVLKKADLSEAAGLPGGTELPGSAELPGAIVRPRADGFDIWLSSEARTHAVERLLSAGAVAVGTDAWERRRVESGTPTWGKDFGLEHFPQETGLDDAVSYTKGCYLGQEIVARIHYRGGVQRRLRGLRIESTASPTQLTGLTIQFDGRAVGKLGSVAQTPDGLLGLSIIHDKATVDSTVALVADEQTLATARVVELPF